MTHYTLAVVVSLALVPRKALTQAFVDVNGFAEFGPFPANMSKRNAFRGAGSWNGFERDSFPAQYLAKEKIYE